jgi:competence protein ComEC
MHSGTIAFMTGIWLVHQLRELPPVDPIVYLLGLIPALYMGLHLHGRWRAGSWLMVGALWAACYASLALAQFLPVELERQDLTLKGVVIGLPEIQATRVRFIFRPDPGQAVGGKMRLSWYSRGHIPAPEIRPGQTWLLNVRLRRPDSFMSPGAYDYAGWLYANGYGATGYVRSDRANRMLGTGNAPVDDLRYRLQQVLDREPPVYLHSDLIKALLIADRSNVAEKYRQLFLHTGTAHLLAISGLHIGLVAGGVFFLVNLVGSWCGRCQQWFSTGRLASFTSLAAAATYAAMAGMSIPTQRALIMITLFIGAVQLYRITKPSYVLAFTCLLVLAWHPPSILSAGFWLSFTAVAIILYCIADGHRKISGIPGLFRLQIWLLTGLLPLTALFFKQVSLVAPMANLVAVPVTGIVIVPCILLAALFAPLSDSVSVILFRVADFSLDCLLLFLQWCASQMHAHVSLVELPSYVYLLVLAGMLILLLPRGVPGRWLGMLCLTPFLYWEPARPPVGHLWISLLDVGQGLSIVLQTHRHTLLYDTGDQFSSRFSAAEAVILPYLHQRGIARLDKLIISHGDRDHRGGIGNIIEVMPVTSILSSEPTIQRRYGADPCVAGDQWQWDGVKFHLLHPIAGYSGKDNDRSCVLQVQAGEQRVLLTGDIERRAEYRLIREYGTGLRTDILLAPHHGSNTSSSHRFLAMTRPSLVLLPVGRGNRFNLPANQVLERYQARGHRILSTARDGSIELRLRPGLGILQKTTGRENRHFWHSR